MFKCSTTARSIFPKKDRVIVIGDLHADYDMTITLFKKLNRMKFITLALNPTLQSHLKPQNILLILLVLEL